MNARTHRWLLALLGAVLLVGCPNPRGDDDDDDATGSDDDDATGDDDDATGGNQSPVVAITAPGDGDTLNTPSAVNLAGTAEDPEDGTIDGADLVWSSDLDGTLGSGGTLTTPLSEGLHQLELRATDSEGAVGLDAISVTVTSVNEAPQAFIDAPNDNAYFVEGSNIVLEGHADDPEDGALSGAALFWSSSEDGALGSGATVTMSSPSIGVHTIVLTAVDSQGEEGLASITLEVTPLGQNIPPTATILAPTNGTTYIDGDTVTFDGEATDPEDGLLSGSDVDWWSSIDGSLGSGTQVVTSALSVGSHTVTFTATDDDGAQGSDSVTITVNPPGNTAPTVSITGGGGTYNGGDTVTFTGTGTDPEDGTLSGGDLEWSSSTDGVLGTGTTLATSSLSVGSHTITLVGTDSGGASATDQVTVTILQPNTAPTVSITAGAGTYDAGDPISFAGNATDPEDGVLTGTALVWASNVDGVMGTGGTLTYASLTVGTHTVTLTGVDSGGLSDSDSITVTINQVQVNLPPNAVLTGPTSGDTGVALTFDGSSSADNDGAIVDYTFDFGDGTVLSAASSVESHSWTSAGTYTVVLTVTDDDGATASDSVTVTITDPAQLPVIADQNGEFGSRCDIAVDSTDTVHVVYRNTTHAQLWYAYGSGSTWTTLLVDGPGFDTGGQVGTYYAIAVDSNDDPHIVYSFNDEPNQVRYATWNGAVWTREVANPSYLKLSGSHLGIALDPNWGERPTIVYTRGNGSDEEPVVTYRSSANSWIEEVYSAANSGDDFSGGCAFGQSGTLWFGFNWSPTDVMSWTALGGFGARESTGITNYSYWTPLTMDAVLQPVVMTDTLTAHRVNGSYVLSAYESFEAGYYDIGSNAAGDIRMGVRHNGSIELGTPTPYWLYDYQGPMDATPFGVDVDSQALTRACFFRSGNLMVF